MENNRYFYIDNNSKNLTVVLHGYTSSKEGVYGVFSEICNDFDSNFLFFDAREVDELEGKGKQWYSMSNNPKVFLDENGKLDIKNLALSHLNEDYVFNNLKKNISNICDDIKYFLKIKNFSFENTTLFGFSQGASVVLYFYLLGIYNFKSFITISCPYFNDMLKIKNKNLKNNILIINGNRDVIIPEDNFNIMMKNLFNGNLEHKFLIKDMQHIPYNFINDIKVIIINFNKIFDR